MTRKRISNADVARALREMSLFLEMEDVPFKPQAYERAAYAVSALARPLAEIYAEGGEKALDAVPGVGKGIARRIAGMLETGKLDDLELLRKQTPIDILALTAVEGIGVKKARALWEALGVRTVEDLERAAEKGDIRDLPHFGERSEQRILDAVAFAKDTAGRRPLGEALAVARPIEASLARLPGVVQAAIAGSIRRHRETIGDVDLLVASDSPEQVSSAFEALPEVQAVLARGPTKTLVRLAKGIDADLRVLAPESFGAALQYFTGSKAHNVALRKIAQSQGLKLNEYGVFRGRRVIAGRTEEEVYEALGLTWIPPEMREDTGEIELAQRGELPAVVEAQHLRGDLHVHSDWTDGTASIEDMARAAQELGREYIVITDHTRDLAMTGGLDEAKLRAQIEAIRKVDRKLRGIRVLAGVEVNIRWDGSLDIDDETLAELDLVGAAVHSHFDQTREQMTQRLVRAVENPHVDVLFHPLARMLGRRRAVHVDFEALLEACVRMGTILEINAQPQRLDLPDSMVRRAVQAGVRVAINSDAHRGDELRFIETFGVGVARRGWAKPEDVVNTYPVGALLDVLAGRGQAKARAHA
jgi:DNA polymerase (family 10)